MHVGIRPPSSSFIPSFNLFASLLRASTMAATPRGPHTSHHTAGSTAPPTATAAAVAQPQHHHLQPSALRSSPSKLLHAVINGSSNTSSGTTGYTNHHDHHQISHVKPPAYHRDHHSRGTTSRTHTAPPTPPSSPCFNPPHDLQPTPPRHSPSSRSSSSKLPPLVLPPSSTSRTITIFTQTTLGHFSPSTRNSYQQPSLSPFTFIFSFVLILTPSPTTRKQQPMITMYVIYTRASRGNKGNDG